MNGPDTPIPARLGPDQPVLQSLMVTLGMVVLGAMGDRSPQRCLPDENHPIQAFVLDRTYEALRLRISVTWVAVG